MQVQINASNEYQIHKARLAQSTSEHKFYEDIGPIEKYELEEYNGLSAIDVTDGEEYSFESFDSGNRLLKTENGDVIIVHHSVVPSGSWSFSQQ